MALSEHTGTDRCLSAFGGKAENLGHLVGGLTEGTAGTGLVTP
jgi:hypothetical protein